jgi:hypothetical protein
MRRLGLLPAALVLMALGACTTSVTEVVLVVQNRGLTIPRDIDKVRVVVLNTQAGSPDLPLCTGGSTSGCLTLPLVATLVPGPDHPSDVVTVQVTALSHGQVVIADASSFVFQSGKRERLDVVLQPDCLGKLDCSAQTEVCGEGGTCSKLSLTPLGANPSFDAGVVDLASSDLLVAPDLRTVDLAPADLLAAPDLRAAPDLAAVDLAFGGFQAQPCVSADSIAASASYPPFTCAAYCQNLGQSCHDDLCTTNRGIQSFGVEAWSDSVSCTTYSMSGGQAFCGDNLSSFSDPDLPKYRCCCR